VKAAVDSWREASFWGALAVLTVAAGVARAQGLAPHTLWYDDLFVAAITRLPFWEALSVPAPVPPGFISANWVLSRVIPGKELALQMMPFVASLLTIGAMGLAARWLVRSRAIGVLAAGLTVLNAGLVHYSVFVKQYTSEFLLVTLLLAVFARWAWTDRAKRTRALLAVAVLACLIGAGTIVVATIVVNIALAWHARWQRDHGQRYVLTLGLLAAFNIAVFLYYLAVLRAQATAPLYEYWARFYVPHASLSAALHHIDAVSLGALRGAFPDQLIWLAWLAPLGLAALLWNRRLRPIGVALTAVAAAMIVLSALRLYPLGGSRTDIFLYPLGILAAAAGIDAISRRLPRGAELRVVCAALVLVFALANVSGQPYFDLDLSNMVRTLDRRARPAHGIVVYPKASTLTAFYSSMPSRYLTSGARGLVFEFDRDRTLSLSPVDSQTGQRQLYDFLEAQRYPRIWLIATRVGQNYPLESLIEMIRADGYRIQREWRSRIKTSLILFEAEDLQDPTIATR